MKITGENTRMIEIAPGEWVHVRGDAITAQPSAANLLRLRDIYGADLFSLKGKRVLILELAE